MGERQGTSVEAGSQDAMTGGRLREIEEVTRRYAQYGRLGAGIGVLPAGLCWLGAWLASRGGSRGLAGVLAAAAPPLAIAGATWARRWYQRHGEVAARPQPGELTPASGERALVTWMCLPVIWGFTALNAVIAGLGLFEGRALSALPLAAVAGGMATAWLGWRARALAGASAPVNLAMFGVMWAGDVAMDARGKLTLLAVGGLVYAFAGVWGHLRYLRLERRLVALRESR